MTTLNAIEISDCTVESHEDGGYRIVAVDHDGVIYIYPKIFSEAQYEKADALAEHTQRKGVINASNWNISETEELVS